MRKAYTRQDRTCLPQHELGRHPRRGLPFRVHACFHVELPHLLAVAHLVAPPPFLPRQAHPPQRLQELQRAHVAAAAWAAHATVVEVVAARFAQQRSAHHGFVGARGRFPNRGQGGHRSPPRVAALFFRRAASGVSTLGSTAAAAVVAVAVLVAAAAELYLGVAALARLVAVLPVQKHVYNWGRRRGGASARFLASALGVSALVVVCGCIFPSCCSVDAVHKFTE